MVSKHEWLGEREHEDKGCGYDEGLPLEHHEEMTNFSFCFFFPCTHFLLFPSPELKKKQQPKSSCLETVILNIKRK